MMVNIDFSSKSISLKTNIFDFLSIYEKWKSQVEKRGIMTDNQ